MTGYNITYGFTKINNKPLTEESVKLIMNQPYINKKIGNKFIKILTKDLTVSKCVIII